MPETTVETADTTTTTQGGGVETKETTQVNPTEKADSFIKSIMDSSRELAPPGGGTTKVETVKQEKPSTEKETITAEAESENAEAEGSFITLNIGGKDTDFDISTEAGLEAIRDAVTDGKLILDKNGEEWVYDLNDEGDIAELRQMYGAAGEETEVSKNGNIFELKIKDGVDESGKDKYTVEKFDLNKPEEREKVLQFAQKGRFFEKEQAEFKTEKERFNQEKVTLADISSYVGYSILNQQAKALKDGAPLTSRDFLNLPFEDFVGSSEKRDADGNIIEEATDTGDRANWNAHNQKAEQNRQKLQQYSTAINKTANGFIQMKEKFAKEHPEITDVDKWIGENLAPYHAPVVTYGEKEYPADTFEMIYTWKNLDRIIKEAEERGRKSNAKAKIERDTTTTKVNGKHKPLVKAEAAIKNIFTGGNDVQIAH
jgi:hypothetical protein